MTIKYLAAPGEIIKLGDLRILKAVEVAAIVTRLPYFKFIECRKITKPAEAEVVVFDADVEVGQQINYDILRSERIAAKFSVTDDLSPEVLALREDFPIVPHLNLRIDEKPRSLCLFDERYDELKLHWTPTMFVERIREWLSLTAKGELHAEDQPLEPLLMAPPFNLVIPFDLFRHNNAGEFELLIVHGRQFGENGVTLIAEREADTILADQSKGKVEFVAIPILGEAQPHGIIHRQPSNISELHDFLLKAKIDLLSKLRESLQLLLTLRKKGPKRDYVDSKLILIIYLPKTNKLDKPEATDIWAFVSSKTIREIGVETGRWMIKDGNIGTLLQPDVTRKGENVSISLLNPNFSYSRELATKLAGFSQIERANILLVGGGALGSQVFLNLIRMGYGSWTIIDEDCLLPHNLARHALSGHHVGFSKAETLAFEANSIVKGDPIANAIVANVLDPSASREDIKKKYSEAEVIIDASTSISVTRFLTQDIESPARRISIFLNPSGNDVVILAEDANRNITLDCLEMQYYRYLANEPALQNHLQVSQDHVRYARSCRDIGSSIPQDLVALHSAICSRGIRNILTGKEAHILIWTVDGLNWSVKNYDIPVHNGSKININGWTLNADQYVLNKICQTRAERLPNETGGVLIGSFDMQRKIVYVVDILQSPPDSVEWPTVYIRGCKGLKQGVSEIQKKTGRMLEYVGEWHSHPENCSTAPSGDDIKAFSWLAQLMDVCGLPALMIIAGDRNQNSFYLGVME